VGQIDLSVPWVVAVGGMMATAATGLGSARPGAGDSGRRRLRRRLGLVNGVGVAFLRLPSMVVTLAVNACPGADGRAHRRILAAGFVFAGDALPRHGPHLLGVPNALLVWTRSASSPSFC
jgi:ribose transport system permease protein